MFDKSCLKTHCARDPSEMECGNGMERWSGVEMCSCWARWERADERRHVRCGMGRLSMQADKRGQAGVLSWEGVSENEKGRMLALTFECKKLIAAVCSPQWAWLCWTHRHLSLAALPHSFTTDG